MILFVTMEAKPLSKGSFASIKPARIVISINSHLSLQEDRFASKRRKEKPP